MPDETWGQRVAAVVQPRAGVRPTLESIQEHCRTKIAGYKLPRELHFVDTVVRSPSGKPDYRWAKEVANIMKTRVCEMFGIDLPIFAFSHCRDVVAAVSKAGGMGVLGALAFSPEQLEIELNWIDEHIDGKPYGVDVVMPASYAGAGNLDPDHMADQLADMIPQEHKDFIEKVLADHNVPALPDDEDRGTGLLGWTHEGARPQVDLALAHPIKLLVNALGPPPKDIVDLAHEHGVKVAALVGSLQQAERQVNRRRHDRRPGLRSRRPHRRRRRHGARARGRRRGR